MPRMDHHTGVVIAEVGFLLMLIAGIWFVAQKSRCSRWPEPGR